jgi:hypothetical protein
VGSSRSHRRRRSSRIFRIDKLSPGIATGAASADPYGAAWTEAALATAETQTDVNSKIDQYQETEHLDQRIQSAGCGFARGHL